jgi:hypothetical protein
LYFGQAFSSEGLPIQVRAKKSGKSKDLSRVLIQPKPEQARVWRL